MARKRSIGINAVLNVIRQGINIIFPLITYPYALRVLGAEGIGKVNYSNSIVSYFSLIAMLGVSTYAVREGAKIRDRREEFNTFISEVFSVNLISTVVSYVLLFGVLVVVSKIHYYRWIIILQSISILLTTLGIDYVNIIHEDYFIITVRSIITRIISLVLLFILVKTPDDYYWYAFLHVFTNGLVCLSNMFYCRRYVHLRLSIGGFLKKHLKHMAILFANTIAISVYVSIDTTMLGWIKGDYYVGLYTAAVNIYNIFKNLLAAIYVVSIPQLAESFGQHNLEKYKNVVTGISGYIVLLLIPIGAGLICLAPDIIMFMGGEEYSPSVLSLQILGGALIFAILGGVVTACINITLGREKENLVATIISAIMNFLLNLFFIPKYNHYGAAFTTLISEAFVMFFCFYRLPNRKSVFEYRILARAFLHSSIGVILIFISYMCVKTIIDQYFVRMIIVFIISVALYMTTLIIIKDEYMLQVLKGLRRKLKQA